MTTATKAVETERSFEETLAEIRGIIADRRAEADRLVGEDGSVEARKEAKSLRLRATHSEKYINDVVRYWEQHVGPVAS